jgi:hypothetical protein
MVFDCVYGRHVGGCDKPILSPEGDSTTLYHIVHNVHRRATGIATGTQVA